MNGLKEKLMLRIIPIGLRKLRMVLAQKVPSCFASAGTRPDLQEMLDLRAPLD